MTVVCDKQIFVQFQNAVTPNFYPPPNSAYPPPQTYPPEEVDKECDSSHHKLFMAHFASLLSVEYIPKYILKKEKKGEYLAKVSRPPTTILVKV